MLRARAEAKRGIREVLSFAIGLVALPLILYLPGAVTWAAFGQRRRSSPSELAFVHVALSVLLSGWLALVLAEVGRFALATLLPILATYCATIALWRRRRLWPLWNPTRVGRYDLAVAGLALLAAILFLRPHEFILGGADAGVYVNVGAAIADDGSILLAAPSLSPQARSELLWALDPESPESRLGLAAYFRFAGIYLDEQNPSQLVPTFFHLYPTWIGLLYSIGGVWLGLLAAPLFGLLGCVAVCLLGCEVFNRRVGVLGALVLIVTPLQIWFSREPLSETLTQFMVLTGLFALTRFHSDDATGTAQERADARYGLLAGLAFGEAFLVRIDTQPLLLGLICYLLLLLVAHRLHAGYTWFGLPFTLLLVHSALHASVIARPYALVTYGWLWGRLASLSELGIGLPLALSLAGVTLLAILAGGATVPRRWLQVAARPSLVTGYRLFGSAAVVLGAVYSYFIRPSTTAEQLVYYAFSGGYIPVLNHQTLVRLGWYISPLGIALAVGGVVLILWRSLSLKTLLLVVLGGGYAALYTYDIMNNPHQIYAMRRFVPLALPAMALFISYTLWQIVDLGKGKPAARWASVALAGALLLYLAYADRVVVAHAEYEGAIGQVASLASIFPTSAVVLFDDRGVGDTLGLPLTLLHGRESYALQAKNPDTNALSAAVRAWRTQGRSVYVVSAPGASGSLAWLPLMPVKAFSFTVPILERTYTHQPTRIERIAWELEIYRVTDEQEGWPQEARQVDVGTLDLVAVQGGFYGRETMPDGTTFRWTMGAGDLRLPPVKGDQLIVRMAAMRPAAAPPAQATVYVGERLLGTVDVAAGFDEYAFPLPSDAGQPGTVLRLESNTFRPQDYGIADSRDLGVLVDRVEIR